MAALAETLAMALRYHESGYLHYAESVYREILQSVPGHAETLHLLGVLCHQSGASARAIETIRQAIAAEPANACFHYNLGEIYRALGMQAEAAQCYEQAVRFRPDFDEARQRVSGQGAPSFTPLLRLGPSEAQAQMDAGSACFQQGKLQEAANHFQNSLRIQPDRAEACTALGAVLARLGKVDEAVASYRQAVRLKPAEPWAHTDLGSALRDAGKTDEAIASFQEALRLRPSFAEAHNNLGIAFAQQRNWEQSEISFREAVRLKPDYAKAHTNLGNVLREQARWDEAAACYEQAVRLQPEYPEAHTGLASVYKEQGKLDEAMASCREVLRLRPDSANAYLDQATILDARSELPEAVASCREALRLEPDSVAALCKQGLLLSTLGRLDEAEASLRRAVELQPDSPEAQSYLASVFIRQGRLDEGVAACRQALRVRPDFADAYNNLGVALNDQGKLDQAMAVWREAVRLNPEGTGSASNILFCLVHDASADRATVEAEHRRWGERYAAPATAIAYANDPTPGRRLRVGYVSPDFCWHPTTRFSEPILTHHDPRRVEVFCYAEVKVPDAATERLRARTHGWRWTCGLSDSRLADLVRTDRIDILIDLAGHTSGNRLQVFALRPAPVQATYIGYPHTTGLRAIDYRLTDAMMDPPSGPRLGTEEPFQLAGGFYCFQPPAEAPAVGPLPARRLGRVTFGSMHRLSKINGAVLDVWCRILHVVPSSRLLLYRNTLLGRARQQLREEFARRGVPDERLDMRANWDRRGYLGTYNEMDVSLDPFPFGGGAIACESLWMGVPYPTLRGDRPAARQGASILSSVGLSQWITDDPDQYIRAAVELAGDLDRLEALRAGMRDRMRQTICDAASFTAGLEDAYEEMWRRWCARQDSGPGRSP